MDIASGHQPHGWMENPRTQWRILARKIVDKWSIFQHAMFDYWRVVSLNWENHWKGTKRKAENPKRKKACVLGSRFSIFPIGFQAMFNHVLVISGKLPGENPTFMAAARLPRSDHKAARKTLGLRSCGAVVM